MPLELSELPEEVQVAFFMFSLLPDYWEGMSGTYMGKHWHGLDYLFTVHQISDTYTIFHFMKLIEQKMIEIRADESEKQRKIQERKNTGGDKNYTHKVQR